MVSTVTGQDSSNKIELRTIFVQTQHSLLENDWVLDLSKSHDWIAGIVGWVDLASPDCESQVERLQEHSKFVGVRHVVQDEPDDNFIVRDDVLRGLKVLENHGVPYDLLFYVKHLKHASTLAEKFPNLKLVINHLYLVIMSIIIIIITLLVSSFIRFS